MLAGRGRLVVDGLSHAFGPDTTLAIPPGLDHQIFADGTSRSRLLTAFSATPVETDLPDGTPIDAALGQLTADAAPCNARCKGLGHLCGRSR